MTIDVLIAHEGAREAVLTALQLPAPIGKLLVQYLAMFRPPRRQLSWERVGTILGELRDPLAAAQIERHGRAWPAPLEYWKAALEQMVQLRDQGKLQLPLKSHGYLLEVIAGMSGKDEAKAEKNREVSRATGVPEVKPNGNPGFHVGDRVEVTDGPRRGFTGSIYDLANTYASLDSIRSPSGGSKLKQLSVPYSSLKLAPQ